MDKLRQYKLRYLTLGSILFLYLLFCVISYDWNRAVADAIYEKDETKVQQLVPSFFQTIEKWQQFNFLHYLLGERIPQDPKTFLQIAAFEGNSEIMHILLEKGADPDYYLKGTLTPLEYAVLDLKETHLACVKQLLEQGADVNAIGDRETSLMEKNGDSYYISENLALTVASRIPYENEKRYSKERADAIKKAYEWIIEAGFDSSPIQQNRALMKASDANNLILVEYILQKNKNLDVNWQDTNGNRVLFGVGSIKYDSISLRIAEQLIKRGADKTIRDSQGKRPYDYARLEGHWRLAKILKPKK